jgi:ADP-heptose:LPS heptosyltransferase
METVIHTLSKNYTILLFGGKNDKDQLEKFQTNKYIFSIAGKLTFSEELNTISNLNGMLSMDSGNAHLAAMYGVKVISIWGVTHPFAGFAPFLQPKENSLMADTKQFPLIPTSIYGNKYPEEYLNAADSITPEAIITKIMQSI